MKVMKRLYIKCPDCDHIFATGFRARSATQVMGFYHLCPKCRRIAPCSPRDYLQKTGEGFEREMREVDVFRLPPTRRVEVTGPDMYNLSNDVEIKSGAWLSSDGAIVNYQGEEGHNHDQQH